MNRNSEFRFDVNPTVDIPRSKFQEDQTLTFTGNVGDLIPYYVSEVLPGDTMKVNTGSVIRLQTPVTPFMDRIYADIYYFFVPNRLVWKHWQNFMGESDQAWLPSVEYEVPQIEAPADTGWTCGTIADYLGIPTGVPGLSVNALPFRAVAKVGDDWFRSTVVQDPLLIPDDETTQIGSNGNNYVTDIANGGMPFVANKSFDYFTGCLPSPQRGPAVQIPLGEISGKAPVVGNGYNLAMSDGANGLTSFYNHATNGLSLRADGMGAELGKADGSGTAPAGGKTLGLATKEQIEAWNGDIHDLGLAASGLEALINVQGGNLISISELRSAFQIQKYYEKLARGGDRYISIIKEFFGVDSPDARLQRSEYLGGTRFNIKITQVVSTNAPGVTNDSEAPLGTTAAYSLTTDSHYDFEKSFTEHGFVLGFVCLRYDHTYQNGIERFWSRKSNFDYYAPVFANLAEMGVKQKEIFAAGTDDDEEIFGYQEAWADYRYKPNRVAGEMRSSYATSLDVWHLADDYESCPQLSYDWLKEDKTNVDRVLAYDTSLAHQALFNITVNNTMIRPMPVNSIPGLVDHH